MRASFGRLSARSTKRRHLRASRLQVDGAPLLSTVTENEAMHFATEREHYVAQSDVQIDLWEPLAVSKSFSVDGGQMVSSFVIDESNTSSRVGRYL